MVTVGRAIQAHQARIESAIAEAEAKTCGEVIVVFTRCAGRYELEESLIGFGTALTLFSVAWIGLQRIMLTGWSDLPVPAFGLGWSLLTLAVGYLVGLLLARLFPSIPLVFVKTKHRLRAAEEVAAIAFHDLHVSNTRAHTGVLILIAEAERVVVVLGDATISKNVAEVEWKAVRDEILLGIRDRKPADGLIAAIHLAGDLLCRQFPPEMHDRDELPNTVRFMG